MSSKFMYLMAPRPPPFSVDFIYGWKDQQSQKFISPAWVSPRLLLFPPTSCPYVCSYYVFGINHMWCTLHPSSRPRVFLYVRVPVSLSPLSSPPQNVYALDPSTRRRARQNFDPAPKEGKTCFFPLIRNCFRL